MTSYMNLFTKLELIQEEMKELLKVQNNLAKSLSLKKQIYQNEFSKETTDVEKQTNKSLDVFQKSALKNEAIDVEENLKNTLIKQQSDQIKMTTEFGFGQLESSKSQNAQTSPQNNTNINNQVVRKSSFKPFVLQGQKPLNPDSKYESPQSQQQQSISNEDKEGQDQTDIEEKQENGNNDTNITKVLQHNFMQPNGSQQQQMVQNNIFQNSQLNKEEIYKFQEQQKKFNQTVVKDNDGKTLYYQCPFCPKQFSGSKQSLGGHIAKAHKGAPSQASQRQQRKNLKDEPVNSLNSSNPNPNSSQQLQQQKKDFLQNFTSIGFNFLYNPQSIPMSNLNNVNRKRNYSEAYINENEYDQELGDLQSKYMRKLSQQQPI